MTESKSDKKVSLDTKTAEQVLEAVKKLRQDHPHVRVNATKLVSWILSRYFAKGQLEKDTPILSKEFFNPRSYLRSLVKNCQSDAKVHELAAVISKRIPSHE